MDILNAGKLELVQSMGNDHMIVQAARISNGAAAPEWREGKDEKLIQYLVANEHMSPFEHAVATFYVKAPIFVMREWMRHRTFSYNELSARYKESECEFFYPDQVRVPDLDNKQSSVRSDDVVKQWLIGKRLQESYMGTKMAYEDMLKHGIARELARSVLPVGVYTETYVTGNFRNWMHFVSLRAHPNAQHEIQEYARGILAIWEKIMPVSTQAFMAKFGT